jgi:hypothetical protein
LRLKRQQKRRIFMTSILNLKLLSTLMQKRQSLKRENCILSIPFRWEEFLLLSK